MPLFGVSVRDLRRFDCPAVSKWRASKQNASRGIVARNGFWHGDCTAFGHMNDEIDLQEVVKPKLPAAWRAHLSRIGRISASRRTPEEQRALSARGGRMKGINHKRRLAEEAAKLSQSVP